MISIFLIFIVELIGFRWGTAKLSAMGIAHDPHGHGISHDLNGGGIGAHAAHGPEVPSERESECEDIITEKDQDVESGLKVSDEKHHHHHHPQGTLADSTATQLIGIAILEFGVVLHRSVRLSVYLLYAWLTNRV